MVALHTREGGRVRSVHMGVPAYTYGGLPAWRAGRLAEMRLHATTFGPKIP